MKKIAGKKFIPTRFDGYYVSEDGEVWTEFNRYTGKKENLRKVTWVTRYFDVVTEKKCYLLKSVTYLSVRYD